MIKIAIWFTTLLILLPACTARQAADQPEFAIETSGDTTVDFMVLDEDTAVFDIISPRGISSATINRSSSEWPETLILRFHLNSLENMSLTYSDIIINMQISSYGSNEIRQSVAQNGTGETIDNSSAFWMPVAISPTEGEATIPLEAGTIDVRIPPAFYQRNPKNFQIHWVDFYR